MIVIELPAGYVQAEFYDLFTSEFNPSLKFGIPYLKKQGEAYRSSVTNEHTIPYLLLTDIKAGVIYVQK